MQIPCQLLNISRMEPNPTRNLPSAVCVLYAFASLVVADHGSLDRTSIAGGNSSWASESYTMGQKIFVLRTFASRALAVPFDAVYSKSVLPCTENQPIEAEAEVKSSRASAVESDDKIHHKPLRFHASTNSMPQQFSSSAWSVYTAYVLSTHMLANLQYEYCHCLHHNLEVQVRHCCVLHATAGAPQHKFHVQLQDLLS